MARPDRPRTSPAARVASAVSRALLFWTPVWVPLVLFAQVSLRGLRPALAEHRRLEACEARLEARLERQRGRRSELEALHQALADPIYVERLRLERTGDR